MIPGSWQRGLSRSDLSDLLQLPEGPGSEGTRQPCNAVATAMPQMASCLRSSLTKVYFGIMHPSIYIFGLRFSDNARPHVSPILANRSILHLEILHGHPNPRNATRSSQRPGCQMAAPRRAPRKGAMPPKAPTCTFRYLIHRGVKLPPAGRCQRQRHPSRCPAYIQTRSSHTIPGCCPQSQPRIWSRCL